MTTSVPNAQRIEELIAELDRLVPHDGAFVRFEPYGGGPDESYVIGNPQGALRLGIALLKVPFTPPMERAREHIRSIATEGLVSDASTIQFDHFELRAAAPDPEPDPSGARVWLARTIVVALSAFVAAAVIVGTVVIVKCGASLVAG